MPEDLSRLSSNDIRRFEKAVSEAKALTVRQEEIAKKVLATEKDIGKVRLASLNEYFDAYSRGLDEIVARKTSQLNDAFLIMEQKAAESLKRTAAVASAREEALKNNKTDSDFSSAPQSTTSYRRQPTNNEQQTEHKVVAAEDEASTARQTLADGGNTMPPTPPTNFNGGVPPEEPPETSVDVYQTLDAETINGLGRSANDVESKNIVDRLSAFSEKYETTQDQLDAIIDSSEEKQADAVIKRTQLYDLLRKQQKEQAEEYAESEKNLEETLSKLMLARYQADDRYAEKQKYQEAKVKDLRIANIQEVTEAELSAQRLMNDIEAERLLNTGKYADETGELRARKVNAEEDKKSLEQLQKAKTDFIEKEELKAKRKTNGILEADDAKRIQILANLKFDFEKENLDKLTAKRLEQETKEAKRADARAQAEQLRYNTKALTTGTIGERVEAFNRLTHDDAGNVDGEKIKSELAAVAVKVTDSIVSGLGDFAKKLNNTIDEIGSYKSAIDTRLQGSSNQTLDGSYWDQMVKDMTSVGSVNPFFKQSDFAKNMADLVDRGIAFDLEQRAFLMTIQSKIANTFDVADGTLLKLIRIQQQDTTAGRLGMEAALNSFLNEMYENTEYLKTVADSVRNSLAEMESLTSGVEAAEVEYQVQKWMGSLYSVGMSDSAVNSISSALGQIAAGQIEGLVNGGAGNLLVMAANDAGLSIADILAEGINSEDTNKLLQSVVNYLAEIAESSKDNRVVQQQLADVFGVKASDLKAATNLSTKNSVNTIYDNSMSYENMLYSLTTMASSMGDRTSLSEKMTNIWENVQYSIAGSMASNPAMYMLYKVATVLDDTTGGISIPAVSVLGNMVDLQTTVADLMRVGAMAGGIIGSFGDLMSGLSNSFNGQAMLQELGIGSGIAITPRGDGNSPLLVGGGSTSTSGSGYVGNSSSSDIKNATMQQANDTKKQVMVEAQEAEEANEINTLNMTVLKIYELLDDVAHGNGCFRVKVDNYGLTKAGSTSAQGGASALGALSSSDSTSSNSIGGSSSSSSNSIASGGVNYGGINGSINFGGWTTIM